MILIPPEKIKEMKCRDLVDMECDLCKTKFSRKKHRIKSLYGFIGKDYCSKKCMTESRLDLTNNLYKCSNCGNDVYRAKCELHRNLSGRVYCNSSCAATYNMTHKTKGTRVSKLEKYIAEQLPALFPSLNFHFNRKDAINSELDIYIPTLKLAFELNGIFHYEPIYGTEKLAQIQNNDTRKYQACHERGIELCVIDSSKLKYFKETTAKPYLDIIVDVINTKMAPKEGYDPPTFE